MSGGRVKILAPSEDLLSTCKKRIWDQMDDEYGRIANSFHVRRARAVSAGLQAGFPKFEDDGVDRAFRAKGVMTERRWKWVKVTGGKEVPLIPLREGECQRAKCVEVGFPGGIGGSESESLVVGDGENSRGGWPWQNHVLL